MRLSHIYAFTDVYFLCQCAVIMTTPIVFTGSRLDRAAYHRKDSDWLQQKLKDPSSRFLPMHRLKALIDLPGGPAIDWRGAADVQEFIEAGAPFIFLGIADFACHFAIDVSAIENHRVLPNSDWGKFIDVRSIAGQLRPGDAGALAQARSMIDWHNRHGFCAQCGSATRPQETGYSRICNNEDCKAPHFPRTDPVVIMMVTKGDECLLGRGAMFPKGNYSCLAGFVEPGETIEQAVRREVFEESGIEVGDVRYHASQPWPYPSSLMIGCFSEALSEDITLDTEELADAQWFKKDQVIEMLSRSEDMSGDIRMPPALSLAHQLAKSWIT